MYTAADGTRWNSKYDSIGNVPSLAEREKLRKRQEFQNLIANRQATEKQRLANEQTREQNRFAKLSNDQALEQAEYNQWQGQWNDFAQLHGRGNPMTGAQGQTRYNPQAGRQRQAGNVAYGPNGRDYHEYTVDNQLAQDAGQLKRMLDGFAQSQSPEAKQGILQFINGHPSIGVQGADDLQYAPDGTVTLMQAGQPMRSFKHAALSNLNNYVTRKDYKYQPGREVDDPVKYVEGMKAYREEALEPHLLGKTPAEQAKIAAMMGPRVTKQYQQMFGPQTEGYTPTVTHPYRTPGFGIGQKSDAPKGGGNSGRDKTLARMGVSQQGQKETIPAPDGMPQGATQAGQPESYNPGFGTPIDADAYPASARRYLQNQPR